ncbi:MAG TPA: YMGG-like glycine zipper-containing protein [Steroidobacteraceae bacterium]|nr:YMGG-like glycine zipper-containing protein [Steroidobacteraceae bacterium]
MAQSGFTARLVAGIAGAIAATLAAAQAQPPTAAAPTSASPAASVGLFVYPAKGQDAAQQSKDETECHGWSKTQSGFDPAAPAAAPAPAAQAEKQGASGERVKGAVRGAAAGAVIGEVADNDASKGAEVGAAAGVLAGGRHARQNRKAQEQKAVETAKADEQAAQAAQQQKVETFKRGMAACLEGRGYTAK